jgi:hypothetical protein
MLQDLVDKAFVQITEQSRTAAALTSIEKSADIRPDLLALTDKKSPRGTLSLDEPKL